MSFSVGIVGLPNVGKSTLFKALTRKQVDIASYPFTTIEPNVGKVTVLDKRLERIFETIKPQKKTPAFIEFVDIAGLVKEAHRGEGLGNQFLAQIRECSIILEVIREFKKDQIEHVEKNINPERDREIIKTEFILKDLETIENALSKIEKKAKTKEKEAIKKLDVLNKIKEALNESKRISEIELSHEEKEEIKEFQFLTEKPVIYLLNTSESNLKEEPFRLNIKMEEEIVELSEQEIKELNMESHLDYLIKACYNILDLITFYTIKGNEEVRAWPLKKGLKAIDAAGKVHTDFKEKFIKAEVISQDKLTESWTKAKEQGLIKTVGKDYEVQDGDIIEFKI